jgi:hypothetical protein
VSNEKQIRIEVFREATTLLCSHCRDGNIPRKDFGIGALEGTFDYKHQPGNFHCTADPIHRAIESESR